MIGIALGCTYVTLTCLFLYLGIKQEAVIPLGILLIIDMVTGPLKAIRIKDELTSKRGILGPFVKISVLAIPFIVGLMGKGMGVDLSWLISVFFASACFWTGYSSIANIYMIITGMKLTEQDATGAIFRFMLKTIEDKFGDLYPDR